MKWLNLFIILLTSPFFLFPSEKYIWILCCLPIIFLVRLVKTKSLIQRTILDWAILILLCQVFFSCIIIPKISISLPKITNILFGIIVFYIIQDILKSEKFIKIGAVIFLAGSIILALIGIFGMSSKYNMKYLDFIYNTQLKIPNINFNLPGAEEGFHPNAIGGTLIIVLPIFISLLSSAFTHDKNNFLFIKRKANIGFFITGLFVISSVLFLTQSRGSWIGLFIGILFLLIIKKKFKMLILALIFLLLTMIVFFSFENSSFLLQEMQGKMINRISLWSIAIDNIQTYPIFGIGMNYVRRIPSVEYETAHFHNHFLHIAAELGLPALIGFLSIIISVLFMCLKVLHHSNVLWMNAIIAGLLSGQIAHLVFGINDSIPLGAKTGIFFWISIGLIVAIYRFSTEKIGKNKIKKNYVD